MDNYIKRHMKENDDFFRNTLERIFEKYSRVDGSGVLVCLQSMTCRTEEGIRPWNGEEVERQMRSLKTIADSSGIPARGCDISGDIQLDDSQTCSDGTLVSVESETVSWESGPDRGAVQSSSLQGAVQPEQQDEELERTLSSRGSLLDLYPSMLCRVGGAWRRQAVTEAANAVLRRYGRRGWPPSHAPKPAHKPWRRGLQAGGAGPGPVVTDSGSSPEELSLLSRTFTVSSDPPSSRCAFPSPRPLPAPLLLPSRSSPQNRLSPRPAYWKWGSPSCPAPLPQRPPLPVASPSQWERGPSQAPSPCSEQCQRRRSFSGFPAFPASRSQVDEQFEELYQRYVCQPRPGWSLPSLSSPLPRALAALALSPLSARVRKRRRAPEPNTPKPKRFREGSPSPFPSPQSWPHYHRTTAPMSPCRPVGAAHRTTGAVHRTTGAVHRTTASMSPYRPAGVVNWPTAPMSPVSSGHSHSNQLGGAFRKAPCSHSPQRHTGAAWSSRAQSEGKSPVRSSTSWQRGFSPSSSRRRLLYGLPVTKKGATAW